MTIRQIGLICAFWLMSFTSLFSQAVNLDSLRQVASLGKEDTNTVIAYRALCGVLGNMQPREGIAYGWKGVALGKKIKWDKGVAGCYLNLGTAFNNLGSYDTALIVYDSALVYNKRVGEPKRQALIYINIAAVHISTGKLELAMQAALQAKPFALASADPDRTARVDMTIGNIYYYQERWSEAKVYYQKCLPVFESIGNTSMAATSYLNLGVVLKKMGKIDSAYVFLQKAKEMLTEVGDNEKLILAYGNLGSLYQLENKLTPAEKEFSSAVKLSVEIGDVEQEVFNKHSLAEVYFLKKQFDAAEPMLLEILEVAQQHQYYEEISAITETLSLLYSAKGNFDKAYMYLQESTVANDTLEARKSNEALLQLQEAYKAEQKQQEIELLAARADLQSKELKQNQLTIILLVVGILFVGFIAAVLMNRYRLKQQLKEVHLRNKIASDLHDDVGSTLSSIKMYSEIIQRDLPNPQPNTVMFLNKISENAGESIENMSDIVWMVKPGADKFSDLASRMQDYVQSVCLAKNIQLKLSLFTANPTETLPMDVRRDVYLIFKEAVNNAAKYSETASLTVNLVREANQLSLVVEDAGKGFDLDQVRGNGLENMTARAKRLKGKCHIQSTIGSGTQVEIIIPIT